MTTSMEQCCHFRFIGNSVSDKSFFFVKPHKITQSNFELDKFESHHLINVLRKKIGSEIWLSDGVGTSYSAIIKDISKNIVSGNLLEIFPLSGENEVKIILGIGILKKDKMDLVVEKATECGVNQVVPLLLDRCIKRNIQIERLTKICLAAVKQCGRSVIPKITDPMKLSDLLKLESDSTLLICHKSGIKINKRLDKINNPSKLLLIIGPEGDFSEDEMKLVKDFNAKIINLGKRRLRSETAVISAISQINYHFN